MRVAVITPYRGERAELLTACCASVAAQTHADCTQIVIADGGAPIPVELPGTQIIRLDHYHDDYGDTPRSVGSMSAIGQSFDAIAYLDADNWYQPDHITRLLALHAHTGAPVCSSGRSLHWLDGRYLGPCPEVDGENFVDTNCLLITRAAFALVLTWAAMPPELHAIGDRVVWAAVHAQRFERTHHGAPTVAYRTPWAWHYRCFGHTPPLGTREGEHVYRLMEQIGQRAVSRDQFATLSR